MRVQSWSPRSTERKSITHVSGTFCYYISGRSTLSGSSRCCPVRPRREMIRLKCSEFYKAGIGGPMKPISDYENTSQVDRGMS